MNVKRMSFVLHPLNHYCSCNERSFFHIYRRWMTFYVELVINKEMFK